MSDIANALTSSIASDGQTVPTANLPMGANKLTNLAKGTAAGDSVNYTQITDGTQLIYAANSTAATQQVVPRTQADALYGLAVGTRLTFVQAAAPTGWTVDATLNDKLIRIDSTAGGAAAGAWAISGLTTTITDTALTIAQMPAHTHTVGGDGTTPAISLYAAQTNTFNNNNITTNSTGGGATHTHANSTTVGNGAWRPAYVNAIICAKN